MRYAGKRLAAQNKAEDRLQLTPTLKELISKPTSLSINHFYMRLKKVSVTVTNDDTLFPRDDASDALNRLFILFTH